MIVDFYVGAVSKDSNYISALDSNYVIYKPRSNNPKMTYFSLKSLIPLILGCALLILFSPLAHFTDLTKLVKSFLNQNIQQ